MAIKINKINKKVVFELKKRISHYYPLPTLVENIPYCLLDIPYYAIANLKDGVKDNICQECAWNHLCPGFPFSRAKDITPKAIKDTPNEIVIEICSTCQLSCPFCKFKNNNERILDLECILSIIDQAHQLGIKAIRLTGGEPTLHPQINQIIQYIKGKNLMCIINTNALSDNLSSLAQTGNIANVLISIQYEDIKNKHILIKKLHNILKFEKYVPILRIGTVITDSLIENFEDLFKLIVQLPISIWELYRNVLTEKKGHPPLAIEKWKKLYNLISTAQKISHKKVAIANSIPLCTLPNMHYITLGNFADDGHSRIIYSILDKEFIPSYFSHLTLGKDVEKAWNNPILKRIRNLTYLPTSVCNNCSFKVLCRGGSYTFYPNIDPLITNTTV